MTEVVLNAALKGSVILAAAWVVTLLLRRASADLRHRIWIAALASVALLLAIPEWLPDAVTIQVTAGLDSPGAVSEAARSLPVLAPLWLAGVALVLLRFVAGAVRLARITRGAAPAGGMLVTDRIASPLTWGVLRPVVLAPSYLLDWTHEQRAVVLAHERAHIARRDWLWQSGAQLLCAVFWFHPLVWFAAARLRQEAEQATDDLVLANGAAAADYAAQLVDVARQVRRRGPQAAVAVPMVRVSAIGGRIASILDPARVRSLASRRAQVAVLTLAVAGALVLAACAGKHVYTIGQGVSAPVPVDKPEPQYPQEAKDSRLQGVVGLSLVVNKQGRAETIRVEKSLDPGLDQAAIDAIRKWTFQPATKDGKPVVVRAKIEVNFRLL